MTNDSDPKPATRRRAKSAGAAGSAQMDNTAAPPSSPPPPSPPPQPLMPAPRHVSPRVLRVVLGVSVALNLLVAGLVMGSFYKMGGPGGRMEMSRDLAFGPFTEALEHTDRQALRSYLQDRAPELRSANAQRRRDIAAVQAALRSQPFDPAAFTTAVSQMRGRLEDQLGLGFDGLTAVVLQMPEAQRIALADRLDRGLRRGGPDQGGDGKDENDGRDGKKD